MFSIFSFSKHILKIKKYVSSNSLYPLTNYNKSDHIQYFFKILKRNKKEKKKKEEKEKKFSLIKKNHKNI